MDKLVHARVRTAAPVGRCLPWCWSIGLRRKSCFAPLFGLAVLLLATQARGEAPHSNFPNRPIRIIVAVPAGGGVDLSTRIAAEALHQAWGQPVTVENRTGGGNNIAGESTLFRLNDHCASAELGHHHGPRGLAAEPWPRTV